MDREAIAQVADWRLTCRCCSPCCSCCSRRDAPGVLDGPDPKQMEHAPDLGYKPVEPGVKLPDGMKMGAPSSVAFDARGHMLVFNRGEHPMIEFDGQGKFVRAFGEGQVRPTARHADRPGRQHLDDRRQRSHGDEDESHRRSAADARHARAAGQLGRSGRHAADVRAGRHRLCVPSGDVFVVEGHGRGEGRVLRFDKHRHASHVVGRQGQRARAVRSAALDSGHGAEQVLVADRENRRVQMFDMDGKLHQGAWKFAGLPCGLLVGPDEQLYLASGFSGQILRLNADGKAVAMMGRSRTQRLRRVRRGALHGDGTERRHLRRRHDQRRAAPVREEHEITRLRPCPAAEGGECAVASRKGIPDNSSVVMPRLVCRDAEAALNFYVSVFDASVLNRRPGPDGRLAHALVTIGPAMVMIETEWPTLPSRAPALDASSPVVIFVYVEDVDATIARAVANGARVLMEAQNQFWGDRVAWIMDPARARLDRGQPYRRDDRSAAERSLVSDP